MIRPACWCGLLLLVCCGCGGSESAALSRSAAPSGKLDDSAESTSLLSGLDAAQLHQPTRAVDRRSQQAASARFTDVAAALGIEFVYDNGDSPEKLMTQAVGGGVGWVDFDRDSYPDLLLVQGGGPLPADRASNPPDRLFRNRQGRRFADVTSAAGMHEVGFSQGVAVGDFDNDGFDDVYVTNVGPDTFYRNLGDGTFEDLTAACGLNNSLWASSAAWGDLDGDGDLDLYVCNYMDYDPEHPIPCFRSDGSPGVCHPKEIDPVPNVLFVNEGDGTFRGILAEAGLDAPGSKSLGVVIADLDDDGQVDLFVANDTTANHLFFNQGRLRFRENALLAGCAASGQGMYQASMGVAFGDFNRDSHPDLYCTHFTSDSNTLYQGLGGGLFSDATLEVGLHVPTLSTLGFGTILADFDCDGRDELFVANGHIDDSFQRLGDRYRMQAQLFAWTGSRWVETTDRAGPYFERKLLGRGVATADYDHDGDIDLAVSNQLDTAALLRNDRQGGHWLKVRLVGTQSNRRGVGSRVVITQGDQVLHSQLAGGTSYCAAHEPVLFFGLGQRNADVCVEVVWPSGISSRRAGVGVDRELVLLEEEAAP